MNARFQRIEDEMDVFAQTMLHMQESIQEVRKETHRDIATLKNTMLITCIGSVVAIVLGIAAFNATVLGNRVASFEAGNHSARELTRVQIQQKLNDKLHDKKREDLSKQFGRQK
jgi:hypothetical protein